MTTASQQLSGASGQVNQLEGQLNQSTLAEQYVTQRQQQLSSVLSQYSNLPSSITNAFNKYKETGYYYKAQVQAYKDMLNDPEKCETTAVGITEQDTRLSAVHGQEFHTGEFVSCTRGKRRWGSPTVTSLVAAGLQSRTQVQSAIQEQVSSPAVRRPNKVSSSKCSWRRVS